jgi:hypothetical protein
MTTTTIKVHVSAADSIKNACQCGWQRIQVDFSDWLQAEREYLATRVKDDEGASLDVSIAPPSAEQLRQWVNEKLSEIEKERAVKKAQALADIEAVKTRLFELRGIPTEQLAATHDVSHVTGHNRERANAALVALGTVTTFMGLVEPKHFGRIEDYLSRVAADEEQIRAAKERDSAERAAYEAKAEANFRAILAAVPDTLRAKFEAGFAHRDEIERSYKASLLAEIGLPEDTTVREKLLTTLSNSEFETLVEARKLFPDLKVDPYLVWSYRKATDSDYDDDKIEVDSDGEVRVEERIVQVIIKRNGVTALGKIPLV